MDLEEMKEEYKRVFKTREDLEVNYLFDSIYCDYKEREDLKEHGYKTNNYLEIVYSLWCRSFVANKYSDKHPNFNEYLKAFTFEDREWLPKGKSVVKL